MIFVKTGSCVEARTASSDDLLNYQELHDWKYHACDYYNCDRANLLPSRWFFSHSKEELLKTVFELDEFQPVYSSGRWHIEGLSEEKFGAMVLTDWGENPETRDHYAPDTDKALLVDAFWIYAQVMSGFMYLSFFGPEEEMEEASCPSLSLFVQNRAWK